MASNDSQRISDTELLEAVEILRLQMKDAFPLGRAMSVSETAAAQRGYSLACLSLANFLLKVGDHEVSQRFVLLSDALSDLISGRTQALLKSAPRGRGRQPDPSAVWRLRAKVAIGMQFLEAANVSEEDAVLLVVKNFKRELMRLQRTGSDLKSSLRGWRKQFEMHEVEDVRAAGLYRWGTQQLSQARSLRSGNQLKELAEYLLADAAADAANIPPETK